MIKVVALGVKDGDLSIRGAVAIDTAQTIIVKTKLTDTFNFFSEYGNVITCDDIYDSVSDFEQLDKEIVNRVMSYSEKSVVFCVNGSGYDDRTVILLKQLYPAIPIFPSVARDSVGLDYSPTVSYLSISAYDLADSPSFDYDSDIQLIVKDIDSEYIASMLKNSLSVVVGEETLVDLFISGSIVSIPLYELDHQKGYDYSCVLIVKPQPLTTKQTYNYGDLIKIMNILRGENGCPWDIEQTHKSIRSNCIEEAYELVDAIDNDDIDNIIEECGDVLLQSVFHNIIGVTEGEFLQHEVMTTLCKKLISRHTHIFGDVKANDAQEALSAWEAAKALEKKTSSPSSKVAKLAKSLPALLYTEKLQKIVTATLKSQIDGNIIASDALASLRKFISSDDKEIPGGELLYNIICLIKSHGIKSEIALNRVNARYINALNMLESNLEKRGKDLSIMDSAQLAKEWKKVTNNENS